MIRLHRFLVCRMVLLKFDFKHETGGISVIYLAGVAQDVKGEDEDAYEAGEVVSRAQWILMRYTWGKIQST
jgi:hypothetical protein